MPGKLYLVSTPIGNLQDITLRALEVLKSADAVAAEDTRHTRQLLAHFGIHARLISYHAFNEHGKTGEILNMVKSGLSVALVSDAGTPAVADPGFLPVRAAAREGLPIEVVPGVSALTFSVTASALPADRFGFWGFVPVKSGRRRSFIEELAASPSTVYVYESPHRMGKTLLEMLEVMGPERPAAVIREATKLHEEVLRGTLGSIVAATSGRVWKGECVIGVGPARSASSSADG